MHAFEEKTGGFTWTVNYVMITVFLFGFMFWVRPFF